jgi:hypothetical protein
MAEVSRRQVRRVGVHEGGRRLIMHCCDDK